METEDHNKYTSTTALLFQHTVVRIQSINDDYELLFFWTDKSNTPAWTRLPADEKDLLKLSEALATHVREHKKYLGKK